MRQSQCDHHKVKMISVFGPNPPFISIIAVALQPTEIGRWPRSYYFNLLK
jgi:hypothetical protein